tara:strand:+ start:32869 stop:33939 length:1071 start_codon:yes stop_codon:yes gene_type:complete
MVTVCLYTFYFILNSASQYLTSELAVVVSLSAAIVVFVFERGFAQVHTKGQRVFWLSLPLRVTISIIFGAVIAVSASIYVQQGLIQEYQQKDRATSLQWYQKAIEAKQQSLITASEQSQLKINSQYQALKAQHAPLQVQLNTLLLERSQQQQIARTQRAIEYNEANNPERGAKCDKICEAAKVKANIAQGMVAELNTLISQQEGKLQTLESQMTVLNKKQEKAFNGELQEQQSQQLQAFINELQQDLRYTEPQPSFTRDFVYLTKLMADPELGVAVTSIHYGLVLFFMVLDLAAALLTLIKPKTEYEQTEQALIEFRSYKNTQYIERLGLDEQIVNTNNKVPLQVCEPPQNQANAS